MPSVNYSTNFRTQNSILRREWVVNTALLHVLSGLHGPRGTHDTISRTVYIAGRTAPNPSLDAESQHVQIAHLVRHISNISSVWHCFDGTASIVCDTVSIDRCVYQRWGICMLCWLKGHRPGEFMFPHWYSTTLSNLTSRPRYN
jgi:hypothetical protein